MFKYLTEAMYEWLTACVFYIISISSLQKVYYNEWLNSLEPHP